MADDNENGEVKERLTRLEERLIAEKSVRKTRDDQLFSFISQVHKDLEKQEHSLEEISSNMKEVKMASARMEERLTDSRENRDSIKEIQGSIQTLKWVWPLIVTLISVILSLFVANVDMKFAEKTKTEQQVSQEKE